MIDSEVGRRNFSAAGLRAPSIGGSVAAYGRWDVVASTAPHQDSVALDCRSCVRGEGRLTYVFGSRREIAALRERIDALEQRVRRMDAESAAARALLEDARRLEDLTERAVASRKAAEAAVEGIRALTAGSGPGGSRFRPKLNVVHRAETIGHVSLFCTRGYPDIVRLLVGPEKPPTECIAEIDVRHELNSSASGIVRPGEYWVAESKRGRSSGVRCVFTPLF